MPMKELALGKVYQLLEPGPLVLPTTAHKGRPNIMIMSWHTMIEFEPPQAHHQGYGRFAVDGKIIRLKSRMR